MSSTLAALGLPEPTSKRAASDTLSALGLPEPRARMLPAHEPGKSRELFTPEEIRRRDLPVVPEYPLEAAASVYPAYRAGKAVQKAAAALPWLLRSMAAGAAAGATGGAVAEHAKGPVATAEGVVTGGAAGAVLSPPLEAAAGTIASRLRPKAPTIPPSPVEPVETLPASRLPINPGPRSVGVPVTPEAAVEPTTTRTGPNTGRTVPQEVRLDKAGLPEDSPELADVRRALDSIGLDSRKVRTFGDMQAAAQELGMRPEELFKGAAARPISDAEVVASGNLINEAATRHTQIMQRLADPSLSESETLALQQQANASMKVLEETLKRRIKGGTESGRAIAAFRIIGQRNMDPVYWLTVAKRRLGEKPLTDEVKSVITAAIDTGDRAALARIVGRLGEAGWADKVATLARAFMLSNPGTDVRNVGGNLVKAVMDGTADLPATMLDALVSKVTGVRSKSVSLRQVAEAAKGVGSGFRKAGEVLRHGDTAEEVLNRYDFGSGTHFDNRATEFLTQAVFRRLGAEDYLFREPARFRAIAELAEVTAKNEGLRGDAYASRVAQLVRTPTDAMKATADAVAAERTFNQPSALASGLQALERRGGAAGKIVGTVVMPFKRTPINVARAIIDYTPVRAPLAVIKYATQRGGDQMLRQRYMVEGVGRSVTGTGLAAIGYMLAQKGMAVGGPPSDENEKRVRQALGIPNYALRVGDQWVSIANNAPAANVLMLGVDAYEQMKGDRPLPDELAGTAGSLVKGLSEQTFVKGVKGASEAFSDPSRFGGSWLESVTGILVPSLGGAVARGTDPVERRIESPLDAILARVPGARETLEPQVTFEGVERPQRTGLVGQVLSPVRTAPVRDDLLARAVEASGYAPAVPSSRKMQRTVNHRTERTTLSEKELTQLQKDVGAAQAEAMRRVAGRSSFFDLEQDEQKRLLRDAAERAARSTRKQWERRKFARGRAQ